MKREMPLGPICNNCGCGWNKEHVSGRKTCPNCNYPFRDHQTPLHTGESHDIDDYKDVEDIVDKKITGDDAEEWLKEDMDWPQYFASGEDVDDEYFVPAYYKLSGPNGPVSYMNPDSKQQPTTMYDFAMEVRSESFRWCKKEETPFDDGDENE